MYYANGQKGINGTRTSYGSSYGNNDVIGIAVDTDAETVTFYKNGVSQGAISYTFSGNVYFFATLGGGAFSSGDTVIGNFGQRPFAYTAPSGFKALCTQNLPTPTIADGSEYFNTVLWTGDSVNGRSISGLEFEPDFIWIKNRSSGTYWHGLWDQIRGTAMLFSNTINAELLAASNNEGYVSAYNPDGFSLTTGTSGFNNVNTTGSNYVAWNWNAGESNATNTDGTVSSTVRANTTAGFSIVSYTGTSVQDTVGHGLGVAPDFIIAKWRTGGTTQGWAVYHSALGKDKGLTLNSTAGAYTSSNYWGTSTPDSTVFGISNGAFDNNVGDMIAYVFAEVEGYSKFGSYTGNGSTDGPFVYCGFRPAFILVKNSAGTYHWRITDTTRSMYNQTIGMLEPSSSAAEYTSTSNSDFDILSNGFKVRNNNLGVNGSGNTMIFAAFAENPFKYSLAR